jgi:hypothetical protein
VPIFLILIANICFGDWVALGPCRESRNSSSIVRELAEFRRAVCLGDGSRE